MKNQGRQLCPAASQSMCAVPALCLALYRCSGTHVGGRLQALIWKYPKDRSAVTGMPFTNASIVPHGAASVVVSLSANASSPLSNAATALAFSHSSAGQNSWMATRSSAGTSIGAFPGACAEWRGASRS